MPTYPTVLMPIGVISEFKTRHIQSMQVYVNAQNYISFANHSGYNPINGDVSHPWAKIITLGINAKF